MATQGLAVVLQSLPMMRLTQLMFQIVFSVMKHAEIQRQEMAVLYSSEECQLQFQIQHSLVTQQLVGVELSLLIMV